MQIFLGSDQILQEIAIASVIIATIATLTSGAGHMVTQLPMSQLKRHPTTNIDHGGNILINYGLKVKT